MDFAASVFCQATNHKRHVQTVPSAGEGGIWRGKFVVTITTADNVTRKYQFVCFLLGVCLPGESYWEDVRLQEAGEEENKEEERGVHGLKREADFRKSQQQICCE